MLKQLSQDLLSLDGLVRDAIAYRSSAALRELLDCVRRFRRLAPFNACLVHVQRPGSVYVASASEWRSAFGRDITPGARPLVILWPFAPVRFVYDVSDTEGLPLPPQLEMPFRLNGCLDGLHYRQLLANLKKDGVLYEEADLGGSLAGYIRARGDDARFGRAAHFRYQLVVNRNLSLEERAATIFHELAHLYCGHLGVQEGDRWQDRSKLLPATQEFEAESVSYLVCGRLGWDNPSSAEFVSALWDTDGLLPQYSLERVLRVTHRIEAMLERSLPGQGPDVRA